MQRSLMKARHLTKAGAGGIWILRGIDLEIPAREFAAILGPPGSGKSTLLRILSFKDRPTAGDLYFEGRLVSNVTDEELAALQATAARLVQPHEWPGLKEPLPPLLLADLQGPPETVLPFLRRLHAQGHAILLATTDPEIAAACRTIYRMDGGRLRLLTSASEGLE